MLNLIQIKKYLNVGLNIISYLLLESMLCVAAVCFYTRYAYGNVDMPQLIFFLMFGTEGVEVKELLAIFTFCVLLPTVLTVLIMQTFKILANNSEPFYSRCFIFVCCALVLIGASLVYNLKFDEKAFLYVLFFIIYLINQWRSINSFSLFITIVLAMPIFYFFIVLSGFNSIFDSLFYFKQNDIYAKEYVAVDAGYLTNNHKRNVIVVFGESLEKSFVNIVNNGKVLRLNDDHAVKFANFNEGYAQRWTQGAMFSAFSGMHIHYLSDFFKYNLYHELKEKQNNVVLGVNELSYYFDFVTPNITYLGEITAAAGYQNLFIQGGKLDFSGTDKFLYKHGFDKNNVYDFEYFKNSQDYEKGKSWWGVSDKTVFEAFKHKILELQPDKPFLAVMFTLDLHRGSNPFFENYEEIKQSSIANLNDFIAWFEKQDFYNNTTLVILADHKKMGDDVQPGGGLYNAFFNLPKNLKNKLDLNRTFNQIDIFPTILEIAGFELPEGKAAMGTSLFAKKSTLAERYNYKEQEKMFSGIDMFYQQLWQAEKINILPFRAPYLLKPTLQDKVIAHAGGKVNNAQYSNSEKALNLSAERRYKYVELDLLKTKDNRIVAAHDWWKFLPISIHNGGKYKDDYTLKELLKINPEVLYDDEILNFFMQHPNIYFVTDKIDDFALLAKKFYPLRNRMIVEVFSAQKYDEALKNGIRYVAYNINAPQDFKTALDNKYNMVTMNVNFARQNADKVKILRETGCIVMLYSVANEDEISKNADIGDVFYYDGTEVLK